MATVAEALAQGGRHQQAGQWAEAAQAYRRALEIDPGNADALHRLGIIALRTGQPQRAIELIGDATRRDHAQPVYYANLAEAYRQAGDLTQAIAQQQHVVRLQPQSLGARTRLAALQYEDGQLAAAVEQYKLVVSLTPEDAAARMRLGRVLKEMGHAVEAEACFRRATQIAPESIAAHDYLGLALLDQAKFEEAVLSFERALAIDPGYASAHNNLGTALKAMNRLPEAEAEFRAAIRLDPQMAVAYNNLGAIMLDEGQYDEGRAALERATALDPRLFQAFCNLARILDELGQFDAAISAGRKAIEINPGYSYGYCNVGTSLKNLGRLEESIETYRTAIQLNPACERQRSSLLFALNLYGGCDAAQAYLEHREWGRLHANPWTAASPPHANDRTPGRRLRVGYLSGHFFAHAVNFFSEPILASHDHAAVEVFCYSNNSRNDETNQRLHTYADHWREIGKLSDDQAAEMIRNDKIDILVDLAGHIAGNRLLVFARKPAPVQVTYLGYQNTTGMQAMDYRLTDDWADPPGETDAFYTEKLVRLPQSFFCYRPSPDAPPIGPLPAVANGYVTFGSFNNFAKVTPEVLATWAQILRTVPGSRIMILAANVPSMCDYLSRTFVGHGVDARRVTLTPRCSREEYLSLLGSVDIALDPFPFNGHTTTCDALWQGVPVVTLLGRMYASRFGSSAHVNLGLDSLVARTPQQYVETAARLAADIEQLAALRGQLRERMAASPLLDFAGFTRHLEAAYRQMWTEWCLRSTGASYSV